MNESLVLIYLRSCFVAGYTFPQYCDEKNLNEILIVATDSGKAEFLGEIYLQFQFDKRCKTKVDFAVLKTEASISFPFVPVPFAELLTIKNISEFNLSAYDQVIFLTAEVLGNESKKIVYLHNIVNYFFSRAYCDLPLTNFLNKNPQVKLIVANFPILTPNENNSEREKKLLIDKNKNEIFSLRRRMKENPSEKFSTPYDFLGYTNAEVCDLLEFPEVKTNLDGSTSMQESSNKFLGIKDGKRMTANQPEVYKNKIYFVGNCVYFGIGVPWQKTLESCLQQMLNDNNLPYRVENESQFFSMRTQDTFYNLNKLSPKAGDIIFLCLDDLVPEKFPFINVRNFFDRPHNYGEVFAQPGHINELGHKVLAEHFFNILTQNNFLQDVEMKIPSPPPLDTSLRHSKRKFFLRDKFFSEQRT